MISIVIPVYNKEEFISKTIQSVLDQSYPNFELLIVNDGSTDASMEIVGNFVDNRIRKISIENSGVSVARNTGIENSQYNWIAFLDADDWWATTYLEELLFAMNSYPENKIFAAGRSLVFKRSIKRYHHKYLPEESETQVINYFKVISKYLPLVNSSNVLIKKELFMKKGMFRKGQRKHEDHDLWMRLCVGEPVVFINKPLSFYLKSQTGSASTNFYDPEDFCTYLRTLQEVKLTITPQERTWFKTYCNRFVLITYIQNYEHYSKTEDMDVFKLAKHLVTGGYLISLKLLKVLPFKNTHRILKSMKG